jgi:hypothetical protein
LMIEPEANPETLLQVARAGDGPARGRLLELYRNYLSLMARSLADATLRARLNSSPSKGK